MKYFIEKADQLGIHLTSRQQNQFQTYYQMLLEKNKVMNLTRIIEWREAVDKHFIDSISLIKAVDLSGRKKILDVGCGAGFPGIPLKIAFPKLEVVLLDSLNKRITFLREVVGELELDDVQVIHGRAEDYARKPEYREQFDYCVSRAVANLSTLSEYCIPYVKVGGMFVSYKGNKVKEELEKIDRPLSLLGSHLEKVISFQLPGTQIRRALVIVKKKKNTPKKYPRKAGLPSKEPL